MVTETRAPDVAQDTALSICCIAAYDQAALAIVEAHAVSLGGFDQLGIRQRRLVDPDTSLLSGRQILGPENLGQCSQLVRLTTAKARAKACNGPIRIHSVQQATTNRDEQRIPAVRCETG
jgi:hypothetical protein